MDYNDLHAKLNSKNLADTFPPIRQKAAELGLWELTEHVETLWQTYQQMMQFMLQGINDSQGWAIRTDLCRQLAFDLSRLQRQERLKNNASEKYVSTRKSLKNVQSFSALVEQLEEVSFQIAQVEGEELMRDSIRQHRLQELEERHENILLNLFNWTWTSEAWQNTDTAQANRLLLSDNISYFDKAVFVSAVALSQLEFADTAKLIFLLDCYLVDDMQVAQRALTSFVLILYLQFDHVKSSRELKERLFTYGEDPAFRRDFMAVMMQLQIACTTERVTSKMRNDIMPALMQGAMKRKQEKKPLDLEELTKHGENPEWTDDSQMDSAMREMAEMQLDGADIYYASFSVMKGGQFFQQIPHWFYPFSLDKVRNADLQKVLDGQTGKYMHLILKSTPFCDSDKYSLCSIFQNFSGLGTAAIQAQIERQMPDGMDFDELAEAAETNKPNKADIRRHYAFDLYRFYNNYPYKQQFLNPFATLQERPITPYSNLWMHQLLGQDKESLAQYADFLMRKEFYAAALQLFTVLADNEFEPSLASIWQKKGFCHQKLNETTDALHAYTVANSIKPNSKWTISHLASLSYAAGQMETAATYYSELLTMNPDNVKYLTHAASALLHSGRFDEAEPLLQKAAYLDSDSQQARLLLAWCLIASGKSAEAVSQAQAVLTTDANNAEAKTMLALAMLTEGKTRPAYDMLHGIATDNNIDDLRQRLSVLHSNGILDRSKATLFADAITLNID